MHARLVDRIVAITAASGVPATPAPAKIALFWSIVHGFATLMIGNGEFASQVAAGVRGARRPTARPLDCKLDTAQSTRGNER